MPGRRLGQRERQQIASGLGTGLPYAEIARLLGRPTSTVSREVTRNGGPAGYRAEYAQHATRRRARRGAAKAASSHAEPDAGGRDPDSPDDETASGRAAARVRTFTEEFATVMVESGMPRMAARVFASLLTSDSGSLTAVELTRSLRVSPASVSKAIGYLEGLEVVRREREPRRRRERYVVDHEVWFGSWSASAHRVDAWARLAERGARLLGADTAAGARLEQMAWFFGRLGEDMAGGSEYAQAADALTVVAALAHAAAPLRADQLASALGWDAERVAAAVRDAQRYQDLTDPVALRSTDADGSPAYVIGARAGRLDRAHREALGGAGAR